MQVLALYARERLWTAPVLAVTLIVASAAYAIRAARCAACGAAEPIAWLADAAAACLLVAQFRLWDDLADRDRDARLHPERVLVRAPSALPFVVATLCAGAINAIAIVWRWGAGGALITFVALTAVLGAWYAAGGPGTSARDYVPLAKYPTFVVAIAGGPAAVASLAGFVVVCVVVVVVCVYEAAARAQGLAV